MCSTNSSAQTQGGGKTARGPDQTPVNPRSLRTRLLFCPQTGGTRSWPAWLPEEPGPRPGRRVPGPLFLHQPSCVLPELWAKRVQEPSLCSAGRGPRTS